MKRRSVAIYVRISKDPTGTELGVRRQERDCRKLCEERSWPIAEVFVENDVSAYSGRRRPLYDQLLAGLRDGLYDAVVAWHPDRLHRHPSELEAFVEVIESSGALVATVTAGDIDLTTPEGRLVARITGAVARKESEDKSRRLRRKHLELAEAGQLAGGGRRPFGYQDDRRTLLSEEAAEIRRAAERVLAGESLRSITTDWNDRGVATVTGARWSTTTVKRVLTSARIAGLREHHGIVAGEAVWEAIIDADTHVRLRTLLGAPSPGGSPTPRSYLLTGLIHCGRCGTAMTAAPVRRKGRRYRRYACRADRGGCGRCGIGAEPAETLIAETVLEVLATPEVVQRLERTAEHETDAALGRIAELEERLQELAGLYAEGSITRNEWMAARSALDRHLVEARQRARSEVRRDPSTTIPSRRWVLEHWSSLSVERRQTVLSTLIERVEVAPTTKSGNLFDGRRLSVTWRA